MNDVSEQLAWEAEQRPRAMAIAIAAGLLTFAGNALLIVLFRNGPGVEDGFVSVTEALDARLQGQELGERSLFLRQAEYYGDNVAPFVLTTLLTTAAVVCIGLTLAYLYRASAARLSTVGRLPIIMTVIGAVSFVIGHLVRDLATWISAAGLADDAGAAEARDALGSATVLTGGLFEQIGGFALGVAFALVALNAMRAGLLTRFLGILGVIVGATTIFPLDQPQIVRGFWLVAVGVVAIGGRGRAGLLPAWQTGQAEPWPTQQQLREQRDAAAGRAPRAPAPAPEPDSGDGAASAGEARRKRKRRK